MFPFTPLKVIHSLLAGDLSAAQVLWSVLGYHTDWAKKGIAKEQGMAGKATLPRSKGLQNAGF